MGVSTRAGWSVIRLYGRESCTESLRRDPTRACCLLNEFEVESDEDVGWEQTEGRKACPGGPGSAGRAESICGVTGWISGVASRGGRTTRSSPSLLQLVPLTPPTHPFRFSRDDGHRNGSYRRAGRHCRGRPYVPSLLPTPVPHAPLIASSSPPPAAQADLRFAWQPSHSPPSACSSKQRSKTPRSVFSSPTSSSLPSFLPTLADDRSSLPVNSASAPPASAGGWTAAASAAQLSAAPGKPSVASPSGRRSSQSRTSCTDARWV